MVGKNKGSEDCFGPAQTFFLAPATMGSKEEDWALMDLLPHHKGQGSQGKSSKAGSASVPSTAAAAGAGAASYDPTTSLSLLVASSQAYRPDCAIRGSLKGTEWEFKRIEHERGAIAVIAFKRPANPQEGRPCPQVILAYRGTMFPWPYFGESVRGWANNVTGVVKQEQVQRPQNFQHLPEAFAHGPFFEGASALLDDTLKSSFIPDGSDIFITGHSQGGGLALTGTFSLLNALIDPSLGSRLRLRATYAFAPPLVGNASFRDMTNGMAQLANAGVFRVSNQKDPVPLLPPPSLPNMPHQLCWGPGKHRHFVEGERTSREFTEDEDEAYFAERTLRDFTEMAARLPFDAFFHFPTLTSGYLPRVKAEHDKAFSSEWVTRPWWLGILSSFVCFVSAPLVPLVYPLVLLLAIFGGNLIVRSFDFFADIAFFFASIVFKRVDWAQGGAVKRLCVHFDQAFAFLFG